MVLSNERKENYFLTEDEEDIHGTVAHKSHIKKVTFLCTMARPRYENARKTRLDGKWGIWPVGINGSSQTRFKKSFVGTHPT